MVTGVLARRRREEMQGLNRKLRHINAELRRQREAQDSLLSAVNAAAAPELEDAAALGQGGAAGEASGGGQTGAALEALQQRQQELQQERSRLEAALAGPAAAHPSEGFGDQRLSLARARRRIAQCIRWVKPRPATLGSVNWSGTRASAAAWPAHTPGLSCSLAPLNTPSLWAAAAARNWCETAAPARCPR